MKIETFQPGSFRQQFQYRSFVPVEINGQWTWESPEIHQLLAEANRHLGELNGLSLIVPDVDRFIQMHVVKEAQTSSRIGEPAAFQSLAVSGPHHLFLS